MKLHVVRTGGFAGIALQADVDTSRLEPDERETLIQLVENSAFFSLPAKIEAQGGGYDRFQYEITVEDAGSWHTVSCGDSGMDEHLSELVRLTLMISRRLT